MTVELPDFEIMYGLADEILELSIKAAILKNKIKFEEARVIREATTNSKYFKDGKAPATNFVESAYKFTGFENEIMPLRDDLIKAETELDHKQILLNLYKIQVDVWRSQQANERKAVV